VLKTRVLLLLFMSFAIPLAALACGGDDDDAATGTADGTTVTVHLTNWAVEPSSTTVKAGRVSFTAIHEEVSHGEHGMGESGATHQLVVARLEDGAEVGQGKFGSPALNLADIKVGKKKSGEAVLEPGRYELSCLVVEEVGGEQVNHYEEGMYALLTVE